MDGQDDGEGNPEGEAAIEAPGKDGSVGYVNRVLARCSAKNLLCPALRAQLPSFQKVHVWHAWHSIPFSVETSCTMTARKVDVSLRSVPTKKRPAISSPTAAF